MTKVKSTTRVQSWAAEPNGVVDHAVDAGDKTSGCIGLEQRQSASEACSFTG
jgi:hypothetical protein